MNITQEGEDLWGKEQTLRQWLNLNIKYNRIRFCDVQELCKQIDPDKKYIDLSPLEKEIVRNSFRL
jgi:hypothetical protein